MEQFDDADTDCFEVISEHFTIPRCHIAVSGAGNMVWNQLLSPVTFADHSYHIGIWSGLFNQPWWCESADRVAMVCACVFKFILIFFTFSNVLSPIVVSFFSYVPVCLDKIFNAFMLTVEFCDFHAKQVSTLSPLLLLLLLSLKLILLVDRFLLRPLIQLL